MRERSRGADVVKEVAVSFGKKSQVDVRLRSSESDILPDTVSVC